MFDVPTRRLAMWLPVCLALGACLGLVVTPTGAQQGAVGAWYVHPVLRFEVPHPAGWAIQDDDHLVEFLRGDAAICIQAGEPISIGPDLYSISEDVQYAIDNVIVRVQGSGYNFTAPPKARGRSPSGRPRPGRPSRTSRRATPRWMPPTAPSSPS